MTEPTTHDNDGYEDERHRLQEKQPKCSINLQPMGEWIEGDTQLCRPCLLPVTLDWYRQELNERGHPELVEELDKARMSESPDTTCKTMDEIKDKVPVDLKYRLMEFDCSTQEHAADMEKDLTPQDEVSPEPFQPVPDSSGIESETPPETLPPELQETEL